jgi:Skp family chaperone for outer membrane proteins
MTRRKMTMISIDVKIEKARLNFEKATARYDAAAKDLQDLMAKKEAIRKDELIKAISKSSRSYDEIMAFLSV